MLNLSNEERTERQRAVDFARGCIQLAGGELSAEIEVLNTRYIAGELLSDEHVAAMIAHARTLPESKRVQEYFSSVDDAMKANPDR